MYYVYCKIKCFVQYVSQNYFRIKHWNSCSKVTSKHNNSSYLIINSLPVVNVAVCVYMHVYVTYMHLYTHVCECLYKYVMCELWNCCLVTNEKGSSLTVLELHSSIKSNSQLYYLIQIIFLKTGQLSVEDITTMVLCKPKLLPLKSLTLEKLEKMQQVAQDTIHQQEMAEKEQQTPTKW